jgi:hypothetical protein
MKRYITKILFVLITGFVLGLVSPVPVQAYWNTILVNETGSYFHKEGTMWNAGGYGGHSYSYQQKTRSNISYSSGAWDTRSYPTPRELYWSVYIPPSGRTKAIVRYHYGVNLAKKVNQNNYNNTWTSIGSRELRSDTLWMDNLCIPNTVCNFLEVYWDHARYKYWMD